MPSHAAGIEILKMGPVGSVGTVLLLLVALGIFSWVLYHRYRLLTVARKKDDRFSDLPERIKGLFTIVMGQNRVLEELWPGLLHAFIFWGFCVVSVNTVTLIASGIAGDPAFRLPLLGNHQFLGIFYNIAKDAFELLVVIGVVLAAFNRIVIRPYRLGTKVWEPVLILFWIFMLMVTDFLIDGAIRYFEPGYGSWSPVGYYAAVWFKEMLGLSPEGARAVYQINYWVHVVFLFSFLNYLPFGKHFHVLTIFPHVFFRDLKPKGVLNPIENIEEQEHFGVEQVEQMSWKDYMDLYTCTECGRCKYMCPTDSTGKPLSMKDLNLTLKTHLYDKAPYLLGKKLDAEGKPVEYPSDKSFLGDVVSHETIWACTMCGFCEEMCPVFNENLQRLVDMRQNLVLFQGDIPAELANTFRNVERNSNPWGLGYDARADWAKGMGVKTLAEDRTVEFLYYVGCAGSYDDRYIRVNKAFVRILQKAGVSFGILGTEEGCCGDFVRRTGNEYMYQMLAKQNIETMTGYGVKKIIVNCPHGYNTLKHEYPQFGGNFEVVSGPELLKALIEQKRIDLNETVAKKVLYHDSCYYGRMNEIYEEPRDVVRAVSGTTLTEAERHHSRGYCCGAGGGNMWKEEGGDKRINYTRFEQIKGQKPDYVATACPFCMTMLDDAVKKEGLEDSMKVRDLAEIVWEAMGKPE